MARVFNFILFFLALRYDTMNAIKLLFFNVKFISFVFCFEMFFNRVAIVQFPRCFQQFFFLINLKTETGVFFFLANIHNENDFLDFVLA